jgi:hypothetical protein
VPVTSVTDGREIFRRGHDRATGIPIDPGTDSQVRNGLITDGDRFRNRERGASGGRQDSGALGQSGNKSGNDPRENAAPQLGNAGAPRLNGGGLFGRSRGVITSSNPAPQNGGAAPRSGFAPSTDGLAARPDAGAVGALPPDQNRATGRGGLFRFGRQTSLGGAQIGLEPRPGLTPPPSAINIAPVPHLQPGPNLPAAPMPQPPAQLAPAPSLSVPVGPAPQRGRSGNGSENSFSRLGLP